MVLESKRKLQLCNGYLFEFEQFARLLDCLSVQTDSGKIRRETLVEATGLANRQVESLVSIGAAMGLVRAGVLHLTPIGRLIARHDMFIDMPGTLEWLHFEGAGAYRNLIWHEIFNRILPLEPPMPIEGWTDSLRQSLEGQYSDRTLGKHLREEVRFVADAYLSRNFRKLDLLKAADDGRIYRRHVPVLVPLVLAAMLYAFGERAKTELLQVDDLLAQSGAPGTLFALEKQTLREMIEALHRYAWVRYESTHNLDQVRLRPEFNPIDFLTAYYENHEPRPAFDGRLL